MTGITRIDLTGQRFGRLLVVKRLTFGCHAKWLCRCDCGTEREIRGDALSRGITKSCGCFSAESTAQRMTTHGYGGRGKKRIPEYAIWNAMIQRCENPNHPSFNNWGGRSITVCAQWHEFPVFFADVGPRPHPKKVLDRFPDPNGNYEPGNVRWATTHESALNKRKRSWVPRKYADVPTGKQFWKWTVLARKQHVKNQTYWECRCDCGFIKFVSASALTLGKTSSCRNCSPCNHPNSQYRDGASGKRFFCWTVLNLVEYRKNVAYWECRCDCGTVKFVQARFLIGGMSKDCGCRSYGKKRDVNV